MSNSFSKPIYIYKRFRVKRTDRGSTTVSIDPALVVQACKHLGSLSTVSRIVRESAAAFDPALSSAKNRSAHVAKTLQTILAAPKPAAAAVAEAPVVSKADVAVETAA